jgi:hypothetical protein
MEPITMTMPTAIFDALLTNGWKRFETESDYGVLHIRLSVIVEVLTDGGKLREQDKQKLGEIVYKKLSKIEPDRQWEHTMITTKKFESDKTITKQNRTIRYTRDDLAQIATIVVKFLIKHKPEIVY